MTILDSGINLMLYGMGTVFVFLSLLIVATMGMSWFLNRFFPQAQVSAPASITAPQPSTTASDEFIDPRLLAVLQAAVQQHREKTLKKS